MPKYIVEVRDKISGNVCRCVAISEKSETGGNITMFGNEYKRPQNMTDREVIRRVSTYLGYWAVSIKQVNGA